MPLTAKMVARPFVEGHARKWSIFWVPWWWWRLFLLDRVLGGVIGGITSRVAGRGIFYRIKVAEKQVCHLARIFYWRAQKSGLRQYRYGDQALRVKPFLLIDKLWQSQKSCGRSRPAPAWEAGRRYIQTIWVLQLCNWGKLLNQKPCHCCNPDKIL